MTKLLSVSEAAKLLGVTRQTVYAYIYYEGLPSVLVRGIRRIRPEALQAWTLEHEVIYGETQRTPRGQRLA